MENTSTSKAMNATPEKLQWSDTACKFLFTIYALSMTSNTFIWRYWAKTSGAVPGAPYHPLPAHALDAAAVAHQWLRHDPALLDVFARSLQVSGESTQDLITHLVGCHDFGKWLAGFQVKVPTLVERLGVRVPDWVCRLGGHGGAGLTLWQETEAVDAIAPAADSVWKYFLTSGSLPCSTLCHHGDPEKGGGQEIHSFSGPDDGERAREFLAALAEISDLSAPELPGVPPDKLQQRLNRTSWLLNGFVIACDWLASNEKWFPLVSHEFDERCADYWERACAQAEKGLSESGLLGGGLAPPPSISQLCPKATAPTELQRWCASVPLSAEPTLFVLEDATGAGKTEAAMILASRLAEQTGRHRIALALPTMATANAMFSRLSPAMDALFAAGSGATRILAHSNAAQNRSYQAAVDDEEVAEWFAESSRKRLFASLSVATIDQHLKAILKIRYQSLRLLAVSRTVLILDEVHAYDAYMNKLIRRLLEVHAHYGGSAILLSATLPAKTKRAFFEAYTGTHDSQLAEAGVNVPCATYSFAGAGPQSEEFGSSLSSREVGVQFLRSERKACDFIAEHVAGGRCVCWVRNTVRDALQAFDKLRGMGISATLFHARFTQYDRNQIEEDVLRRFGKESGQAQRAGRVLIATQVVEQSLDIDFDAMISDLAPIDLLLQRLGRMRRHVRDTWGNRLASGEQDQRGAPVFRVLSPLPDNSADATWLQAELPGTAVVYDKVHQLWLSARYLEDNPALMLPDDYREAVESVYRNKAADRLPGGLRETASMGNDEDSHDASQAILNAIAFSEGYGQGDNAGPWPSDRNAMTRIGEPTLQLRLIRFTGGQFQPWPEIGEQWELGEVRVRRTMLPGRKSQLPEAIVPDDADEAYQRCLGRMPDNSKWAISVPLQPADHGNWAGELRSAEGNTATLVYNPTTGLEVHK